MRFGDCSDAELTELAKAGWSPAFAVLVQRHAPMVHATLSFSDRPLSATTTVFIQAMQQLRQRDADSPVGPWLLDLADASPPAEPSALTTAELDAIWQELHRRWPDGEPPATRLPWRRVSQLVALVLVAALVPLIVVGIGSTPDEPDSEELRAVPFRDRDTDDTSEDDTPAGTDMDDPDTDADGAPPTFTFPTDEDESSDRIVSEIGEEPAADPDTGPGEDETQDAAVSDGSEGP